MVLEYQQRFDLAPQILVPSATLLEEHSAPPFLKVQHSLQQRFNAIPVFRLQPARLLSSHATATAWQFSSLALQSPGKLSTLQRFRSHLTRHKTAVRPHGFFWSQFLRELSKPRRVRPGRDCASATRPTPLQERCAALLSLA